MSNKMKVAAITEPKKLKIKEVNKPSPKKNDILVKVKTCALCTWEQRVFTGDKGVPFPLVGGHEVSGTIEEIGEGINKSEYSIGDKVAVRTLNYCGKCYYCRQGKENLCPEAESFLKEKKEYYGQGGLGQYINVDISSVFKLNDDVLHEHGAFAEPLACVVNSVNQGKIQLGDDIIIMGAGTMGLLHVMIAKLRGARVIVSEPDETRRQLSKKLGADITLNPLEDKLEDRINEITSDRGGDVVFNTTAIPSIAKQATEIVGKTGKVIMYSSIHPNEDIKINPNWIHHSQIKITGAVSPSINSFQKAVDLLNKKLIDPSCLISDYYPLEETGKAFEQAIKPDTFRIIITD